MKHVLLLSLLVGATLTSSSAQAAPPPPTVTTPAWAARVDVPTVPLTQRPGPVRHLLVDNQLRFDDEGGLHQFFHTASELRTAEGVQDGSTVSMTVAPYQRLQLHHARIHRGDDVINALAAADWHDMQQEADLSRRMLNGHKTKMLILHGTRPGDVVDVAYSVVGSHPSLKGQVSQQVYVAHPGVHVTHTQVTAPSSLPVQVRLEGGASPATKSTTDKHTTWTWHSRVDVLPHPEPWVPTWHVTHPQATLSTFASWDDVRRWARPLYAVVAKDPSVVEQAAAPFQSLSTSTEKVKAILQFVQDDIRYLGMEIGAHSLVPHAPDDVLQKRYGDCKDKVVLLRALLGEVGVHAVPVLVDTRMGRALQHKQPGNHFDHVVALVDVDGAELLLDPTRFRQRGPLPTRQVRGLGHGLVVGDEKGGLRKLPEPTFAAAPLVDVDEAYVSQGEGLPAMIHLRTTYRGFEAEAQREVLVDGKARIDDDALAYYQSLMPGTRLAQRVKVVDDEAQNVLVMQQAFMAPAGWSSLTESVRAWALDGILQAPVKAARRHPWAVTHPQHVRHVVEVRQAGFVVEQQPAHLAATTQGDGRKFTSPAFVVQVQSKPLPDGFRLVVDGRTRQDHVLHAQLPQHKAQTLAAQRMTKFRLPTAAATSTATVVRVETRWWPGILLGMALAWALSGGRALVRRRRFARKTTFAAGERATEPLTFASAAAFEAYKATLTCRCGQALTVDDTQMSTTHMGDSELQTLETVCPTCEARVVRYADVDDS